MNRPAIHSARHWVKTSDHPCARALAGTYRSARSFELIAPRPLFAPLYLLHRFATGALAGLARIFYWTPLFRARAARAGRRLYLYGGLPYVSGPLTIRVGDDCRISGQTTFSGRAGGGPRPELIVGDNVDIGWRSTIAVGRRVVLGNNVRIAGGAFFAGYPGHPVDAVERARGLPDTEDQIGDIVVEDDAWIATGVTILPGVRIGERSIVGAGSVVSGDIPADVIAAGVPAKVVRSLGPSEVRDEI